MLRATVDAYSYVQTFLHALWHLICQDVGCAYMMDNRHAEDTLFLFCESDFRFYEAHDVSLDEWLAATLAAGDATEPLAGRAGASSSSTDPLGIGLAPAEPLAGGGQARKAPAKRRLGVWEASGRQLASEMDFTEDVKNVVRICNDAMRIGRGNFVWLGWNGNKKAKSRVVSGTHFMAFTPKGARLLLQELLARKPGPIDMVLVDIMYNTPAQQPDEIGCCFVWPAVGQQAAHISMATPTPGDPVSRCNWKASWIGQGAGPVPNKGRWLCRFIQAAGAQQWLSEINFKKDLAWKTRRPPSSPDVRDEDWQDILWERWWIDSRGWWVGPEEGRGQGRRGKGEDQRLPLTAEQQELKRNPAEHPVLPDGSRSPISRLAEQIVTDERLYAWSGVHTQRETRARRQNIAAYRRRIFVDSWDEACV